MTSPASPYQPIAPAPPASAPSVPPISLGEANTAPFHPIASTSTSAPETPSPSATTPGLSVTAAKPAKSGRSGGPPKKKRRSKVESACRFCRKSHMACDGQRPCARCVKREIAHLCTDEPAQPSQPSTPPANLPPPPAATLVPETANPLQHHPLGGSGDDSNMLNTLGLDIGAALRAGAGGTPSANPLAGIQGSLFGQHQHHQPEHHTPAYGDFNMALLDLANDGLGAGLGLDMTATGDSEFQGLGLSEFLASLNDTPFLPQVGEPALVAHPIVSNSASSTSAASPNQIGGLPINNVETHSSVSATRPTNDSGSNNTTATTSNGKDKERDKIASAGHSAGHSVPGSPINKTERFLLTAADQKDGSRSDRLARVIHAKFEAGLLRPYNHVAGYTRLMKWMADNMSASSRQRTLHTLSEFRPTFRAIASGLTDLDLVFIEEAFERLLLDYDRVFSSMGIPSCLWRRTGEIYKGNKEFAALVGVPIENLQGGKLAIYELMAEESAVNYWEKYGNIAFDVGQKAVLTSCVLINQSILSRSQKRKRNQSGTDPHQSLNSTGGGGGGGVKKKVPEEAMVSAAFSFTIRRDSYGIPSMIVGNFLKL
ncbi:uncharacterized protein JCM15063_001852 [Sporobolomyces koalae]|uniref:uncharacterized protein n=1 Tax=Sporobolomyces koalae TaxID=500713 RepID=UPI00316C5DF8